MSLHIFSALNPSQYTFTCCATVFISSCHPQERKASLKNLRVSVFKLVLHTKLDRTFLPSVRSSCKELHRRRFHCTTTNFIGLSNPRDYTTQWAPSTGIQLFIHVYRYKEFLYSWTQQNSTLKDYIFFSRSAIRCLFRSLHGNTYISSLEGKK